MNPLKERSAQYRDKLRDIKVFITDVDGVLTRGYLAWTGKEVGFNRSFHCQDGYGLKMLMKQGLKVGVVSGGNSLGLKKRVENLRLDFAYLGNEDKRESYNAIKKEFNVEDHEILYIGDELFDIPLLKKCGFAVTVPIASYEVKEICDYVTERGSGEACVREVVDLLRYAQGWEPKIDDF